jgi:hypothetical protein
MADMTPGLEGFAKLGSVVAGAGGEGAYEDQLRTAFRVQTDQAKRDKARSDARIMHLREVARTGLEKRGQEAGYTPFQLAVLGSNATVDLDQLGKTQLPNAVANLALGQDALERGDVAGYNDRLAIATGREREPFSLAAGGKAAFRTDTGELELTPLGEAALRAEAALEVSRGASADASRARADATTRQADARVDLTRRTDPNRPRGGGTAKPKAMPDNARQGKDGKYYVPDPARPGKYLRVDD